VNVLRQLLTYQFMVNAFRAGTIVALLSAAAGWFMVLRKQTFAGHTLAVVGFPGAAGAVLIGVSVAWGYFGFCLLAAVAISMSPRALSSSGYEDESALIGSVQALLLALGFLFVSLYSGNLNGLSSLLFGSFLGITSTQVLVLLFVALVAGGALVAFGRTLFFASVDPVLAEAAGVPVRAYAVGFLLLLAIAVAEAAQVTGALLVFALLVLPAATSWRITSRPILGILLAAAVGVGSTWAGLALAYFSSYPTGVYVTSIAFVAYVIAHLAHGALSLARRIGPEGVVAG
jgi:zinc/manganese transport system permease protein